MNFKNNTDNLDQHFLVSEKVINKFIEISNLTKNDICLEIGPGKGILTKIIAPKVKKLTVIEKDERLEEYLKEIPNINIIIGDAIKEESFTSAFVGKGLNDEVDTVSGATYSSKSAIAAAKCALESQGE